MLTLPERLVFLLILVGSAAYFVRRIVTLVKLIRLGQPDHDGRVRALGAGVVRALADVFLQRKVLRKPWAGFFHLLVVWGFVVFAVNTVNHFAGAFLPGFHLFGNTVLAAYYATLADLFALLIIVGVLGLAIRRYVFQPENLTRASLESAVVLLFIGGAMVAYLWNTGCEIALGELEHPNYHFAGAWVAKAMADLEPGSVRWIAHLAWWCDALMHLVLIALLVIPTKHLHLVAAPINLALLPTRARGQMSSLDLEDEEAERFGVSRIEEYTWKQNLDLYACIECGRCQEFCPTYNSEKPLVPKHLIVDLKRHLLHEGPKLLSTKPLQDGLPALVGAVVHRDAVWACTTCGACVEHCPMGIEHVDKLTDLRRHLVLMESSFPEEADATFRNMENAGNPWGLPPTERADWTNGLDVPLFKDKQEADVLYWVGCSGSHDERNMAVSVAMVKILKAAGVNFAILGEEERCTCESARRLGNEYLFQMATQEILETLGRYRYRQILVTCPHCLNTFKNEYPAFGGHFNVVHHTQFISNLVQSGKLTLKQNLACARDVVFHDSCYLGRYNQVFDAPRFVLEAAGCALTPVPREREKGLCCGAGGGRMWLEETLGKPINRVRVRELLASGAGEIAASCPFCITMLSDAVKDEEGANVPVRDIAEIVATALEDSEEDLTL